MATPRSTPSMNVPATQNTAPVIRFRCLYTYDMRRKAKRWQDGFLRYHTFNKRVMVYDVAGNFVGDHHWRQDEGIQDGDELKLDNGALIEVCEPVEKTETDLSGLYSNKRKGQGSPSQRPGGTPTPTTVVYNSSTPARPSLSSQQKPTRSLNDLLGIKKTPTQRAGSPQTGTRQNYTLPVIGKENEQVDYPAKRKKTETASEKVARRREPASIDLTGPEPAPGPEISKRQTETSFSVSSRTNDPKNHTTTSTVSHLKPTDRSNNKPQRKQTAPNPPPPKPQEQPQDPIPEPVPEPESPKNNDPPANILRLPSKTKPSRKKLMYHTILAQQQQQQQQEEEPQQQPQPQPQPEYDSYDPIVVSDDDDDNLPPSPPPHQQHNTTTIPNTTTPRAAPPLESGIERRTSLQKSHSDPTAFDRFNMNTTTTLNNNDDDDNCHLPPQQHHDHRRRASESGNSPLSRTDTADNANNHEDESETGGPWTWEAQYLFDYWPAGRAKPTKTC